MDDLRAAFDAAAFREQGHRTVEQLAAYLQRAQHGTGMPVLPPSDPDAMSAAWPEAFGEGPAGRFDDLLERVLAGSNHLHHPRYVGHQVTAPLPLAALCDLVAALLNNGMAVYEMGPVSTAMERSVLQWMARQVGFSASAAGILTSGGSVGNLTALLAARQARAGFDAWNAGHGGGPPLAVLAADQAHYSVQRAVQIMGWGRDGLVAVETDGRFRLRPEGLPDALRRAQRAGRRVIAVVANACSTATGTFDPLEPIADFCAAHDLWLHVDAAHGASALLSPKHRALLSGIERADSVVWDAHKMLLMPALVTAVLFRDGQRSYAAFAQDAAYLFAEQPADEQWFNGAVRTLECTKRMMSLKLYAALSLCGTRLFADYVSATFDLAQRFAARLTAASDFELPVEPESNIVCFRHTPTAAGDLDRLQERIRRRLLGDGSFYLVQTRLPTGLYLRTTLINPFTSDDDLAALITAVRRAALA